MFNPQATFDYRKETKTLILAKEPGNPLSEEIISELGESFETLPEDNLITLYSLKKLASKKIIIVDKKIFKDLKEREKALKHIIALKEDVIFLLDTFNEEDIESLFEGLTLAQYRFNRFKSSDPNDTFIRAYTEKKDYDEKIHRGIVLGEAINHAKELVNTPYCYLNAEKLAEYALALTDINNVKVDIYDKKACEAMNMGAFLGVNKGSKDEPRLIHIQYKGNNDETFKTTLVGKGVMFDTGGYSLKTPQGMPNMKGDMAGAATVLGCIEAISRLKLRANVDVVIAATDNRIGDNAIVPDDILTAANGTTIEIISTDAEGRLTLADALWFAQQKGTNRMIDVATLTGAIVAALGKEYTGGFTNNQDFLKEVIDVAATSHEPIWQMPINQAYKDSLKSFAADIKNSSGARLAGASVAAAFLQTFIENDTPWVHLDIAGTSFEEKTGATGVMVKTLTKLFM